MRREKFTHKNCTLPTSHLGPPAEGRPGPSDDNDDCNDNYDSNNDGNFYDNDDKNDQKHTNIMTFE